MHPKPKICLMFQKDAEEATRLYVELFQKVFGDDYGGSKILKTTYYTEKEAAFFDSFPEEMKPGSTGSVKVVLFQLNGMRYIAVNGGAHFHFTEGLSIYVECETQEQIDALWETLSEGGEIQECGWLKDKFGLSWQIQPFGLLEDDDTERAERVMMELYKMKKIDLATLRKAYEGN